MPQFRASLPDLKPGISEIFAHPVADGAELRAYDPNNANTRAGDYETVTDAGLAQMLRDHAIRCISFRPLRSRMRDTAPEG